MAKEDDENGFFLFLYSKCPSSSDILPNLCGLILWAISNFKIKTKQIKIIKKILKQI